MGDSFIVLGRKNRKNKRMSEAQKRINEMNFEKFMQIMREIPHDQQADYTLLSNQLDRRLFHNYLERR